MFAEILRQFYLGVCSDARFPLLGMKFLSANMYFHVISYKNVKSQTKVSGLSALTEYSVLSFSSSSSSPELWVSLPLVPCSSPLSSPLSVEVLLPLMLLLLLLLLDPREDASSSSSSAPLSPPAEHSSTYSYNVRMKIAKTNVIHILVF